MGVSVDITTLRRQAEDQGLTPGLAELWETAADPRFPGAILPVMEVAGLTIYAVAESQAEWRKLYPLLTAFVGATLSDFVGAPRPPDPSLPFGARIAAAGFEIVSVLRPGPFASGDQAVTMALTRLRDRLSAAPVLTTTRPKPTSRLLAEWQDALNVGDLAAAGDILGVLRNELRLDAANLARLEMQLLAAGGRWSEIRWHPRFEALVYGAPPPSTALLLLEAIHAVQFRGVEQEPEQAASAQDPRRVSVAPLVTVLLKALGNSTSPVTEWLAEWLGRPAVTPDGPQAPVASLLAEPPDLAAAAARELAPEAPAPTPTTEARSALMALMAGQEDGDPDADDRALQAMTRLSSAETEDLLRRPVFAALWDELQIRRGGARPPANWTEWLARLADPAFDAGTAARNYEAWTLADVDIDPLEGRSLAHAVLSTPEGLAVDRLSEALPHMVAWAKADARWPRASLAPTYLALLTVMAVSSRGGEALLKSAAPLFDGCLRTGLSGGDYRDALDAVHEIARSGLGRNSVYEVLDLVETALSVSPADVDALQQFSLAVLGDVAALSSRLTAGQQTVLASLAREVGWDAPLPDPGAVTASTALSRVLDGADVAIYSLTEGAARKARDLLTAEQPSVRVSLSHDHGGTSSLAAIAQRADIFVIAWASATHAATDFIRARRTDKPILYAAGKGAASIIKALEDHAVFTPPDRT